MSHRERDATSDRQEPGVIRREKSEATTRHRSDTKRKKYGVGCQDRRGGIKGKYVELRTTQAVNLNLKIYTASEKKKTPVYSVICAYE